MVVAPSGLPEPEPSSTSATQPTGASAMSLPPESEPVDALAPYLLGNETSPKVYALWRLEALLCGNTKHASGDYSEKVLVETLKDGYWWDRERETTPCKVVKAGLWPPSDVVARAKARADERLAEKRRKEYRHPTLEFYSETAIGRQVGVGL